jgi:hypothetical protein
MNNRKKVMRGLQSIRTHTGRSHSTTSPHQAYMRISVLEMEKHRRNQEKEKALEKVREIEARFQEIDTEKGELLQIVGEEKRGNKTPSNVGTVVTRHSRRQQSNFNNSARAGAGLKIKY